MKNKAHKAKGATARMGGNMEYVDTHDCATTAAAIIPPHQGKTAMGDTFSVIGANQAPVHTKPSPVLFMVNHLGKVL